jgi:hypothetical protein
VNTVRSPELHARLDWRCERCARPASALTVDTLRADRALHRYERDTRAVEDRHRDSRTGCVIVPLGELPDLAVEPWVVVCDACMTAEEAARGFYWIDVERIADAAAALAWTLHLSEKRWLDATNWRDLMCRVVLHGARGLPVGSYE